MSESCTLDRSLPLSEMIEDSFESEAEDDSDSSTFHPLFADETAIDGDRSDSSSLLAEAAASQAENRREFIVGLTHLIRESDFEFGFNTPADRYVHEALVKYGVFAREWMNELFLKSFSKPSQVCGILRVIAHFEYLQMYPQGVTMAIAALRHKDAAVRECGIRCFENWEQPSNLVILRNLEIEEGWLREYLLDVIADLEGLSGHVTSG